MDEAGTKYALLVAPDLDPNADEVDVQLTHGLRYARGSLEKLVAAEELDVWRKAFGSFSWDELRGEKHLVLVTRESERANVLDSENLTLSGRVAVAWEALTLINAGEPIFGTPWTVTGRLVSGEPLRLGSVRSCGPSRGVLQPFYAQDERFWASSDFKPQRPRREWMHEWAQVLDGLNRFYSTLPYSPLVKHGLLAFMHAQEVPEIEFRIPNFVRAAETVIALPKREGFKLFAERGAKLLDGCLDANKFLGGRSIKEWLEWLYLLRSECVHGKIPFAIMQAAGGKTEVDAARLEYVAEQLARAALTRALRSAVAPFIHDRDALNLAWTNAQFP